MPVVTAGVTNARVEPAGRTTPSTPLKVLRSRTTFDRTWSPYIQGELVVSLQSAADAAATDPRKGLCVKFTLWVTFEGVQQTLDLVAWLRARTSDFGSGETTLSFASVESLLQDAVDLTGQQYASTVSDVAVLGDALSRLVWTTVNYPLPQTASTTDGSAAFDIAADDAGWNAGVSLWDIVSGVEEPKGLSIRGDESGVAFIRSAATWTPDSSTHTYTGSDRIISVTDTVDRDSPDWANAVFINYPNSSNNFTDYGALNAGTPLKSVVLTRQTKRSAAGAATRRARRMLARGRNLQLQAFADLDCRPNKRYRTQFRGYDWTGTAQAVTFSTPAGLMDLTLNIVES